MIDFFETLLATSFVIVAMTWIVYPLALYMLRFFFRKKELPNLDQESPVRSVAILVAVYNEENNIKQRIENLLSLRLPDNTCSNIYILSDGSSDKTIEYAKLYEDQILIKEFDRIGRAEMHNKTIQHISEDVVVFTDAETIFDKDFIKNILRPFQDDQVGVVVGRLKYKNADQIIGKSESLYWKYEQSLRRFENDLGLLSNGTGAAMAVKRELCDPMRPGEDVDTAVPIQMIIKKKKVVYEWSAVAYDNAIDNLDSSFVSKIRGAAQTIFCWKKFFQFPIFVQRPLILISYVFHRFLRYGTFLFLLLMLISTMYLGIFRTNLMDVLLLMTFLSVVVIIFLVYLKRIEKCKICISITSLILSFVGMFLGMVRGFLGKSPAKY